MYRSTKKKPVFDDQVSINAKPLSGTGCIDDSPEDGKTYYYAVMAITAKSRTSIFSEEVRAQIPTAKRSSSTFPPSSYPLCRGDGVSNPAN